MMIRKMKYIYTIAVLSVFLTAAVASTQAQEEEFIDNSYYTGAKEDEIDTLQLEKSMELAEETAGLLEREIDPDEYIMGPNDELAISIISTKTKTFKVKVSPEGKILVEGVGVVDCKGKSLTETKEAIRQLIDEVYRSYELYVVLHKLRKFKAIVSGAVRKSSIVPATAADRVSEVIERAGGLKYNASLRHIMLLRDKGEKIIPVDLLKFNVGYKEANPTVLGGDQVVVPESNVEQSLQIWGEVANEGIYEFVEGDSLSTLFKFAHGFLNSSFLDSVEVARFSAKNNRTERWFVDLSSWRRLYYVSNKLPKDFPLQSGDRIYVRKKPTWPQVRHIIAKGEVNLPGKFAINKTDSRVFDILMRAGGPTDEASLENAVFVRQKEIKKIDREMERLGTIPSSEMSENERKYYQARKLEQKGVMAINFKEVLNDPSSDDNILIMDDDSIYIPPNTNFINVQGRVNNPGLATFKEDYDYMDYINQAGGFGYRADEDETFIVKRKGEQFLASEMNYTLEPGDNILVPPEEETRINWWMLSTQITTMLGMLAAVFSLIQRWN